MEVDLVLVAKIDSMLADLKNIKGGLGDIDNAAKKTGTDLTNALKTPAIHAGTLRSQLRNAKEEVARLAESLGPLAPATLRAAQSAGELSRRFKEVQAVTAALDPAAKFQAFSALGQGIAGSFEIATGAMALFGSKSADVEKVLLRVQAAMAFAQGLNHLLLLREEFTNIAAVVKVWVAGLTVAEEVTVETTDAEIAQAAAAKAAALAQQQLTLSLKEQVVANEQLALSTEVETVALEGTTVATEGAAAATGILATAIEVLTGPIGIVIGALGIVVGLLFAFSKNSEEVKVDVEALIDSMNGLHKALETVNEIDRDKIVDDAKVQVALAKDNADKILAIELDKNNKIREFNKKTLNENNENPGFKGIFQNISELAKLSVQAAKDQSEEGKKKLKAIEEQLEKEKALGNKLLKENRDLLVEDELLRIAHDQKVHDLNEKFQKDIADDNNKLDKLNLEREQLITNLFGGQSQIDLQRETTEKVINAEVKGIRDQAEAIIKSTTENADLVTSQKTKIINQQNAIIEQAEENGRLKLLANEKTFSEASLKQSVETELLKNRLLTDIQQKAVADFIANQKLNNKKIQDAANEGTITQAAADIIIRTETNKGILEINNKFADDYLKQQHDFNVAKIEQTDKTGKREIDVNKEIQINLEKENIKFYAAEIARLQAFEEAQANIASEAGKVFDTGAIDAEIEKLKAASAKSNAAIDEITNQSEPISLADILGLKLSKTQESEFNAEASAAVKSAVDIYTQLLDIRKNEVDQQIAFDQQLIDSLDNRINETERQLDREIKLHELGFASNIATTQAELESEKKQREKALADKQKLMKQEQALARQQAAIAAIQQVASLGTAAAKIFEKGAFTGPVGIITAIATIAGMLAAFLSFKASLTKATTQTLGEGGWIKGKSHAAGGVYINAEHDEFMMRRHVATKHPKAMEAINEQNWESVPDSFLIPMLRARGIRLSTESTKKIIDDHNFVLNAEASAPARLDKLEKLHGETNEHLKVIKNKLNDQEQRTILHDGSTQIVRGNKTIIILPKK